MMLSPWTNMTGPYGRLDNPDWPEYNDNSNQNGVILYFGVQGATSGNCQRTSTDSNETCGTEDQFGSWSWEDFLAFLNQAAHHLKTIHKDTHPDYIPKLGIYEWDFVPNTW